MMTFNLKFEHVTEIFYVYAYNHILIYLMNKILSYYLLFNIFFSNKIDTEYYMEFLNQNFLVP